MVVVVNNHLLPRCLRGFPLDCAASFHNLKHFTGSISSPSPLQVFIRDGLMKIWNAEEDGQISPNVTNKVSSCHRGFEVEPSLCPKQPCAAANFSLSSAPGGRAVRSRRLEESGRRWPQWSSPLFPPHRPSHAPTRPLWFFLHRSISP